MDSPNRRAVLQVVGKWVDISLESEWGDRPLCTRIVAIETLQEKFVIAAWCRPRGAVPATIGS